MKKSLLALFAAAAFSSGMAMAETQEPTEPEATPDLTIASEATFQWSGLIPERDIVNATGLFIKKADGSRDFLEGSLVFTNVDDGTGKDKIALTDSTTLSFEVHSEANADTPLDTYDWQLRYIKVGTNEQAAAAYYKGTFFDLAANDTIVEREKTQKVTDGTMPTNLKIVSRNEASETDDIAKDFKALNTVTVQAAIIVKNTGDFPTI